MRHFWEKIISQKFKTDSLINISGTILNSLFGLVFFIVVSRVLGPSTFGIFAVLIAILVLLSDIFDFGTNQGLVKFVSFSLARGEKTQVLQFLKLGFGVKILSGLFLIFLGFLLAFFITKLFLPTEFFWPIFLVFLGVLPTLLVDFSFHALQGLQKFVKSNFSRISANIARLTIVLIFLTFGQLNLLTSVLSFALSPVFGFLIGAFFLPKKFLIVRGEFSKMRDFFKFNFWMMAYFILFSIYSRIDTLMLASLSGVFQTGIYSVAVRLISPFMQASGNFSTALAPNFTRLKNSNSAKDFFWQSFKFALMLASPLFLIIFIAPLLIPILFGSEYSRSISSLQILTVGIIFLFISVPATTSLVYFFEKPKVYAILTLFQILTVFIFGLILIPRFGAQGAAFSFVISQLWLFSSSFIFIQFKKR